MPPKFAAAIAALGALFLVLSGAATANAADRSELRGAITVSASVTGGGTLDGFAYEVTSPNCVIDAASQATTDAGGTAVFSGLFVELPDGAPCLYDIAPAARAGYAVDSGGAVLTGLTAGTIAVVAPAVELTASTGILDSPTRNPEPGGNVLAIQCLSGQGTSEMRAGRNPLTGECTLPLASQSGLGYTAPATPLALVTGSNELGRLTHFNQTIQRGFHNATLSVTLTFTDPVSGDVVTVTPVYTIAIDETEDLIANPANCEYTGPGVPNAAFACADRVAISGGQDASFEFGGVEVNLQAGLGLVDASGACGAPQEQVFTAERTNTAFCLIATVSEAYAVEGAAVAVTNVFEGADGGGTGGGNGGGGSVDEGAGPGAPQQLANTGAGSPAAAVAGVALLALGLAGLLLARRRSA